MGARGAGGVRERTYPSDEAQAAWEPFAAMIASQTTMIANLKDETLLALYESRHQFATDNCWWATWEAARGHLGREVDHQVYLRAERAAVSFLRHFGTGPMSRSALLQ